MNNYSIYLPNYSIGPDVYSNISSICSPYGSNIIAIGGTRAMAATKTALLKSIKDTNLTILDFIFYGGEASYENIHNLLQHPLVKQADMIFAIGGGKALDTCKCLGIKCNKPVFTFPTIASTCAACTTVSIMYHPNGTFMEPFFFEHPAAHVFINTAIIAKAPTQYLWAGMGDTYAKHYECTVSTRNDTLEHFNALGVEMSAMCVKPILMYGKQALTDNHNGKCSYEFEQTVLAIVVTTAIVSILVTTEHTVDYNSGLAHAIFYAFTSLPIIEQNHLHGEVVGFGVLILLLVDQQRDAFDALYQFNQSVGLPTKLSDIEVSKSDLLTILPKIVSMPDIQHYAYKVTLDKLKEAFLELEKINIDN